MRTARRLAVLALAAHAAAAAAQPAHLVADLVTAPSSTYGSPVAVLAAAGGKAFFTIATGDGREVWGTDGTAAGTGLLADACPGACTPVIDLLGRVGDLILWTATNEGEVDRSHKLVRSDGTRAGTYRLAGPSGDLSAFTSYDQRPVVAHGRLFFSGHTTGGGGELWQSDGTEAGTVQVTDIGPGAEGSAPEDLVAAGSALFFSAQVGDYRALYVIATPGAPPIRLANLPFRIGAMAAAGTRIYYLTDEYDTTELWTSDGTAAGTRMLRSFPTSHFGDEATWLEAAGDRMLFAADDGTHGPQIWRSDGTVAGTMQLSALPPGLGDVDLTASRVEALGEGVLVLHRSASSGHRLYLATGEGQPTLVLDSSPWGYAGGLQRFGERIVFQRLEQIDNGPRTSRRLWTTDGTAAGTTPLMETCSGCSTLQSEAPTFVGGLFFSVDETGVASLRRTDGTVAGTRLLATFPAGVLPDAGEVALTGDRLFFAGYSPQTSSALWVMTTTSGTTRPVSRLAAVRPSSRPRELAALGDRLLFTARQTGSPQPQLWTSSGTAATTVALTALVSTWSDPPGPAHSTVVGDQVFFWIDELDYRQPRPLWRSDGTAAGTFPLLPEQRIAEHPAALHGELFYVLDEPDATVVWKSDGTAAGTEPAFELPAGVRRPQYLTAVGDELYFLALSVDGTEVWRSDGTAGGVHRVTAFTGDGPFSGDPGFVKTSAGVIFLARDSYHDIGPWVTGGTPDSTHRVPGNLSLPLYGLRPLGSLGGSFYFLAFTAGELGLWRTDGSDSGTARLLMLPNSSRDVPREAVPMGGELFFITNDGIHGIELWATDGTATGTRLVADVAPGAASSSPRWLTVAGGTLYFSAHDGAHGFELWKSDGTAAGTRLVHDIAPGAASSFPQRPTVAGSRLYFSADDGAMGEELWALDLGAVPGPCKPSATALCLGGHFRVEASWMVAGQTGAGRAVPLTADTGGFWFFGPENVEVVLKVLDGRPVNQHRWVFYGALSDVEYHLTVTDTETGLTRRYVNPAGQLASVADTTGFGRLGAFGVAPRPRPGAAPRRRAGSEPAAANVGPCVAAPKRLCLRDGRFAVEATWKDFAGHSGNATAVPLTGDTGWFWFFGPTNVEVILKILDGTPVNGKHWVFYGALSNVEYTLRITDTTTGAVRTYTNPSGNLASVADTGAF